MIGLALLALLAQDGFFEERVAPILAKRCLACHNNELDDGDISFENRETLVRKREEKGPAVIPGDPEGSPLVRALRHDGDVQMPPGKKLPQVEIDVLIEWIRRGALWGAKGK